MIFGYAQVTIDAQGLTNQLRAVNASGCSGRRSAGDNQSFAIAISTADDFEAQSMSANPLDQIPRLYHFTDRRNLSLIREHGGLHPIADLVNRGVNVPAAGGNQWSRDADKLKGMGKYVHLCFRSNHPMEYLARQDGRIGDTIFLEIHPSVMQFEGVRFTQDVSNKAGVESVSITQAADLIDFQVLYTRTDWSDTAIQQRLKQAEKYEVLVPCCIPLSHIRNF